MNLIELIGFVIAMFALFFLYIKRMREEKWRKEHPEEYEKEQQRQAEAMRAFMREVGVEVDEEDTIEEEDEYYEEVVEPPPLPVTPKSSRKTPTAPKPTEIKEPLFPKHKTQVQPRHIEAELRARTKRFEEQLTSSSWKGKIEHEMKRKRPSRGKQSLKGKSLKQVIIGKEIIGPPKAYDG